MEFLLLITIITGDGISTEQVRFGSDQAEKKCLEVKRDIESRSYKGSIYGIGDIKYKAECIKIW